MTHPQNGRFTRTIVNRLWHRLMGRGIVHPVDAMHTEPWSADLLDWLAFDFADHNYDLKHTIALIATSDIYQAQTPSIDNEPDTDDYVFRGPHARRMTAEQFVDCVWQLTDAAPTKTDAQLVRARVAPVARHPLPQEDPLRRASPDNTVRSGSRTIDRVPAAASGLFAKCWAAIRG